MEAIVVFIAAAAIAAHMIAIIPVPIIVVRSRYTVVAPSERVHSTHVKYRGYF